MEKFDPQRNNGLVPRRFVMMATNGLEHYVVDRYGRRPMRFGGWVARWAHCGGRGILHGW